MYSPKNQDIKYNQIVEQENDKRTLNLDKLNDDHKNINQNALNIFEEIYQKYEYVFKELGK